MSHDGIWKVICTTDSLDYVKDTLNKHELRPMASEYWDPTEACDQPGWPTYKFFELGD